jgi:enamine deaminase RidA (YjgF/YER057c/UK114 family)
MLVTDCQETARENEGVRNELDSNQPGIGSTHSRWMVLASRSGRPGRSNLILVSGQTALDYEGNLVGAGDMHTLIEQVFENIACILTDQGATFDDVVNSQTFLTDGQRSPSMARSGRVISSGKPRRAQRCK